MGLMLRREIRRVAGNYDPKTIAMVLFLQHQPGRWVTFLRHFTHPTKTGPPIEIGRGANAVASAPLKDRAAGKTGGFMFYSLKNP